MRRVLFIIVILLALGELVIRLAMKDLTNDNVMREVQDYFNEQVDEEYGEYRYYREFEANMDALIEGMHEGNADACVTFANWYNSLEEKDQLQVRDWAENTYEYSH